MKKPLRILEEAARGRLVWQRLKDTNVLVIDEISMMENHHFERLNKIMRYALNADMPFGGVQVVVTGDFCQLPPVRSFQYCITCGVTLDSSPQGDTYTCRGKQCKGEEYLDIDKWAFRSEAWDEAKFVHINLTTIHRQADPVFKALLEKSRMGDPWTDSERRLLLVHPSETKDAVKLFPTRGEVKAVNDRDFTHLTTRRKDYRCFDNFEWNKEHQELQRKVIRNKDDGSLTALAEHRFDVDVNLKEGMLVVLLVNLSLVEGLVNGSQGIVTGFRRDNPSKRSRGSGDPEKNRCIQKFCEQAQDLAWPVVRFLNGVKRVITTECSINQLGGTKPYSLLSRMQVPLLAAWALTVHKSQGMTLMRFEVDLSKSYECGQAYVALSRARSLEGLKVLRLPRHQQGANEEVREFLRERFNIG